MQLQTIQNIPCEVNPINEEFCTLTFTLPTQYINDFMMVFSSLSNLMHGIRWKIKTNEKLIKERIAKKKPEIDAINERYENDLCLLYQKHFETEQNPRVALSLTVSEINKTYPFSCYDICKKLLTKNKLLKKTGFYKSRAKFE